MLSIRRLSLLRAGLLLCLLFLPAGLLADTIILKTGERVSGAIVGQSREAIRISTPQGVRSIPKSEIRSVQFGDSGTSEPDPAAEEARKRREEEERRRIEAEAKRLAEEAYERKREEEARRKAEAKARRQARALKWNQFLVQNAIAPGWGWWEANRRTAGVVYGGLHAALFLRMLDLRRSALAAQRACGAGSQRRTGFDQYCADAGAPAGRRANAAGLRILRQPAGLRRIPDAH